jgi:thioredoxin reductase
MSPSSGPDRPVSLPACTRARKGCGHWSWSPTCQAGTSSRIRNYLGFPRSISGEELTYRALEQAWLFGANFVLAQSCAARW